MHSFQGKGCPNLYEVIEVELKGKWLLAWGDRSQKWSNLRVQSF